jgi:hypothetical protein
MHTDVQNISAFLSLVCVCVCVKCLNTHMLAIFCVQNLSSGLERQSYPNICCLNSKKLEADLLLWFASFRKRGIDKNKWFLVCNLSATCVMAMCGRGLDLQVNLR